MDFNVGDICLINESSIQSYNFWRKVSKQFNGLLCPCSIKCYTKVKIIERLSIGFYMIQLLDSPTKLSVIYKKDLKLAPNN